MGLGGQRRAPAAFHPRKTRYPLYRRLGGSQGRAGLVQKISPLPLWYSRLKTFKILPLATNNVLVQSTHVTYFGHY
jgi:hypothetical protein